MATLVSRDDGAGRGPERRLLYKGPSGLLLNPKISRRCFAWCRLWSGAGGGGTATAEAYIYSWETHGQNPFKCFLRDLGSPAATVPRGVAKAQSSPENPPGISPSHPGRRKASGLVCCILKNYHPPF